MKNRDYFRFWIKNVKLNIKVWMEYRADFILGSAGNFLSSILSIVFFWSIFQTVPDINGWSLGQLMFMIGFLNFSLAFWHLFFEGISPWRLDSLVRNGDFDRVLLRPFNSFVALMLSEFDMDAAGDMVAGILIIITASSMIGFVWSIGNVLLFALMTVSAVLIFTSIIVTISTLTFWITRSREISNILWHFMKFIEFPMDIFNPAIVFILTFVLPLGFISYYPSEIFLNRGLSMELAYLTPLISMIYFMASYEFWKFGLKHYSSTGS